MVSSLDTHWKGKIGKMFTKKILRGITPILKLAARLLRQAAPQVTPRLDLGSVLLLGTDLAEVG
jgi:hypothetical protein